MKQTEILTLNRTTCGNVLLASHMERRHSLVVRRAACIPDSRTTHHRIHRPSHPSQNDIALEQLPNMLKPFHTWITDAQNYQCYRLVNCDQRYADYIIRGIAETSKLMLVQMHHDTVNLTNPDLRCRLPIDAQNHSKMQKMQKALPCFSILPVTWLCQ